MPGNLDENYARAGYHHRLGFGRRPALLMVDFAQAYFAPASPLFGDMKPALTAALALREAAHCGRIPVIMTRVQFCADGVDGGMFFRKVPPLACFVAGNPLGDWADGLAPAPSDIVVTKQYPSAFFATSLAAMLTAMDVDTVIVCGLTTSGCVRASAVDALCCGFRPVVVREAVGDRDAAPHEANLYDLNAKYADVVTLAEALSYIEAVPAGREAP